MQNGKKGYKVSSEDKRILMDLYNRGGFSAGYYRQHNGQNMIASDRPNHAGVPAVKVESQKGRLIKGKILTDLHAGDVLDISGSYTIGKDQKKGEAFSMVVQKQVYIKQGSTINRVRNESLITSIHKQYIGDSIRQKIDGKLTLEVGKPAKFEIVL